MTVRWHLPRESKEWIGPLSVSATADGDPVPDFGFKIAVIPISSRPQESDWHSPDQNPNNNGELGVLCMPLDHEEVFGVWVRPSHPGVEVPVLEPDSVAYIFRT